MKNDFFDSFKSDCPKSVNNTKIVHFKKDEYDIYIGRLPGGKYNKWAYPKELRDSFPEGTPRKQIIEAYREYVMSNQDLIKDLHELKDKTLGCWCKDAGGKTGKSCHGDILIELISKYCI